MKYLLIFSLFLFSCQKEEIKTTVVYTFSGGSSDYLITYDNGGNTVQTNATSGYKLTYTLTEGQHCYASCLDWNNQIMNLTVTANGKSVYNQNGTSMDYTYQN